MPKIYIHIGPYKTGTTSVQEHFWANRIGYLKLGLLYPKTGIASRNWGHRHLNLAKSHKPELWEALLKEVGEVQPEKVLLSAERFSADLSHLCKAMPLIRDLEPQLIVVLRDEVAMVRSMYLQSVKSYFASPAKRFTLRKTFPEWWDRSRGRFVYGRMINQWADTFGAENITYVNYGRGNSFNIVEEICTAVDVPVLKRVVNQNPSISAFAARNAIAASRFGWFFGNRAIGISKQLERFFPALRMGDPEGFRACDIREYYLKANHEALERYPEFEKRYREMHKLL